jgi:type IX secretion system PorP/SprF family membrane protein
MMAAQPHFGEQGNLHYRDYELLINPASAGAADHHLITLGVFKQWAGFESSHSEIIQYQFPVTPTNGLGGWVYNDVFGPQRNIQFGAAYAHSLKLGNNRNLSFGLSFSLLRRSERRVENYDPSDPVFTVPATGQFGFNAGFGAYYFTDTYYIGFSIPQWLTNELTVEHEKTKLENNFNFEQLQYYFTGGYRFKISEKINLTPSILAELSKNTTFGYEGVLTATYDNRFEVGAGLASHTRLLFDFGMAVTKWLSFRYQYAQYAGSNYHKSNDHFIVVRIHWNKKIKEQITL